MLQYSAVRLRHEAINDLLRGPEELSAMLPVKQGELRAIRSEYVDAQGRRKCRGASPGAPVVRHFGRSAQSSDQPGRWRILLALRVGVRQLLIPESAGSRQYPERVVQAQDIAWWRFADIDSALVTSPDGGGVSWYQRRRRTMVSMLFGSAKAHVLLALRWPRLSRRYIGKVSAITSPEAWDEIYAANAVDDPATSAPR